MSVTGVPGRHELRKKAGRWALTAAGWGSRVGEGQQEASVLGREDSRNMPESSKK